MGEGWSGEGSLVAALGSFGFGFRNFGKAEVVAFGINRPLGYLTAVEIDTQTRRHGPSTPDKVKSWIASLTTLDFATPHDFVNIPPFDMASFARWYNGHLSRRPMLVQCLSTAVSNLNCGVDLISSDRSCLQLGIH
jgi:hypothetical protein